jgi:phosphoglycerate-specific signal transduction histidine kinase
MMNRWLRPTIGLRLIIALVALAAIGLGMAAIALWTFDRYGRAAEEIATTETRRLADVARFTEIATGLRAEMPRLVFAETEADRETACQKLANYSQALAMLVRRLSLPPLPAGDMEHGKEFGEVLRNDIEAIDVIVTEQLAVRKEIGQRVQRLRQQHATFLRTSEPLLTQAWFNIQAALRRAGAGDESAADGFMPQVRRELAVSNALLRLQAHVNLILGKMLEAAAEKRRGAIEPIRAALETAAVGALHLDETLRDVPSAATLREIWRDMEREITAVPGLLDSKLREAALTDRGLMLISAADKRLKDLADLVARTVLETNEVSIQAAQRAREAINRGTVLILGFGGATAGLSFLVGWFYVGRRLIARLSALLIAIRGIGSGDLETPVHVDGSDEMGQLADALRMLQKRSQLARERRLALAAANERLSFEIAERRSAQDKLERTQEELMQAGKLAAIGQVSTGIAHEFNQPLAAMRSYLHNAGRYLETGNQEKVAEKLQQIESLLSRLARISIHLKTLARRCGKITERCCAEAVVKNAAVLFETHEGRRRTRLVIGRIARNIPVVAEPNRLEQVFTNLLSNAFDAVAGRPDAEVRVRFVTAADMQRIYIFDNGPGIAPAYESRLFEPFFTTKPQGAGLGLGLAIAFNIIQDFRGRLTIKNRRAGGAVAVVSLPIASRLGAELNERLHAAG